MHPAMISARTMPLCPFQAPPTRTRKMVMPDSRRSVLMLFPIPSRCYTLRLGRVTSSASVLPCRNNSGLLEPLGHEVARMIFEIFSQVKLMGAFVGVVGFQVNCFDAFGSAYFDGVIDGGGA